MINKIVANSINEMITGHDIFDNSMNLLMFTWDCACTLFFLLVLMRMYNESMYILVSWDEFGWERDSE